LTTTLVLMVSAAPALADTTIGNSTPGNIGCGGQLDGADNGFTVPAGGGVITSLSSSAHDPTGQFDLQVLRPNGGGSFTVVGNTGLHAQTSASVQTFTVNIPVSGGEVLGFYFSGGGTGSSCARATSGDSVSIKFPGGPDPAVGSTFQTNLVDQNVSLDVSANLVTDSDLTLDQPSDVTFNATSTAGAKVTYTNPAAHDEDLSTVTTSCLPASGSTFAIGDTTVTCTATDSDGDTNSPVQKTFTVHVKGASEQLSDLATAVQGVGAGTSLADQVTSVQSDLSSGDKSDACGTLGAFINTVKAQQRGGRILTDTATMLVLTAQRIEAVIGC
jgi:hypothetical protein